MGVPSRTENGKGPALVLRCQDQEHAQEREAEDDHGRDALLGLPFLEGHAHVVEAHLRGHGFGEDLLQRLHGLSRAVARRCVGIDLGAAVQVVAHGELGPGDVPDRGQGRKGHRRALAVAHVELSDVLDVGPVLALGLDVDLPLASELVEVVDEAAAHEALQGLVDIVDLDPLLEDLVAVHVDEELRDRGPEGRGHAAQLRALLRRLDEGVHVRGQELDILARPVLEHEGRAARGADAGDGRGRRRSRWPR